MKANLILTALNGEILGQYVVVTTGRELMIANSVLSGTLPREIRADFDAHARRQCSTSANRAIVDKRGRYEFEEVTE